MKNYALGLDPGVIQSDPNKDKFGGKTEKNGRRAIATVEQSSFDPDFYTVTITVISLSGPPLSGEVTFYLHPTYKKNTERVNVANGVATLNLLAWGAFTVGIECDAGKTTLEIDLAELPDAPEKFKNR